MFLENTWRYVKGYVTIKVEGFFIERFLNLCMHKQIELWDITKLNDVELLVKVKSSDLNKINEIASITRCKIIKNNSKGVPHLIKIYKKRKIFVILFVLIIICMNLLLKRVWKLEIMGEFDIPIEEIRKELEIEGVKIGVKKKDLNYDKIKNNIYVRRNDIAWIGFDIKGVKANIEVVQRNNKDNIKGELENVVATKDGVIHKIIVKSGKKMVEVGDFVTKGQVLISGSSLNNITASEKIIANGEVIIKTWYVNKIKIPYEKILVNKTGKKEKKYKLEIGNYEINLLNSSTKYEKYDTITVSNNLKIFGKYELPIKLTELTNEEIEIEKIRYTKKQAEDIARKEAENTINNILPKENIEIIKKECKIYENNEYVTAEIIVECLENIKNNG